MPRLSLPLKGNSALHPVINARYIMLRVSAMSDTVPESEIRQQLARMLRSEIFIKAESQARLLKFLVSQSLENVVPPHGVG
jgi:hypothetical protein